MGSSEPDSESPFVPLNNWGVATSRRTKSAEILPSPCVGLVAYERGGYGEEGQQATSHDCLAQMSAPRSGICLSPPMIEE